MIVTGHQPSYLPWLGYFHKAFISDVLVILDNVQFEKNSYTNRNKIKTPQGEIWLSVPIMMTGHINKTILDMEIKKDDHWQEKHWKSIYLNYKKAPFFHMYSDFFEDLYKKEWTRLIDLLIYTQKFFFSELELKTKTYLLSELDIVSKKQDLIINMTKKFNGDIFVFGAMGKDYVDVEYFNLNGIKPYFQNYIHPSYPQMWGDFLSSLSIIDLLFNVGPKEALEIIVKDNIQKEFLEYKN